MSVTPRKGQIPRLYELLRAAHGALWSFIDLLTYLNDVGDLADQKTDAGQTTARVRPAMGPTLLGHLSRCIFRGRDIGLEHVQMP